jgi:hypothetical protein
MRFCPGTIVKIINGVTDDYLGRIGVVTDFNDEEQLYINTSVIVFDGEGEIEAVLELEEEDLIGCDMSDDVVLVLAAHVYGRAWRSEQAKSCSHLHIEGVDDDALKCRDCGLKTSDMEPRTKEMVERVWRKRMVA